MFIHVFTVILYFIVTGFCHAGRTVQFMYFHKPPDAPQKVFMFEGEKNAVEVELPKHHFSPIYEIGSGKSTLYFLPSLPEKEDGLPKGAPRVIIPAGWQKVLILAFQNANNPVMPVQFRAFNASPGTFGNSDTLFINLSPKVVYGTLGSARVVVKPGKTLVAKNAPTDGKDYNVILWQMNPDKSENYRFLTKVFRHYPNRRKVFLIFMTDGMGEPDYYVTTIEEPIPVAEGT